MTTSTHALADGDAESLADKVRASRLPAPEIRQHIRQAARVSLRAMAADLGVTPMTVQRWETGAAVPRLDHAVAYRRLLDELEQAIRSTP